MTDSPPDQMPCVEEGFDPLRDETLLHKVIMSISTASVPHEGMVPGALESRSLSYYLGVGIDHFRHDYARHEALLQKAAEQAIIMVRACASAEDTPND